MADEAWDDATTIMEALFDVRANTEYIIELLLEGKTMGKKKRMNPEEYAASKARGAEIERRLREAIERRKAEARRRAAGESPSA